MGTTRYYFDSKLVGGKQGNSVPNTSIILGSGQGVNNCSDAIGYVWNQGGFLDSGYELDCLGTTPNSPLSPPGPITNQTSFNYELDDVTYDEIQEGEYKVLNDGTLDVSTDGGFQEDGSGNIIGGPDLSYGIIKVPREIRLFNQQYFDSLMDVKIHELLPTIPAGWPKKPPVLRQVWPHKAGPGGWPAAPEVLGGYKNKNNIWTRQEYYQNLFPGTGLMPDPPIPGALSNSWGPITSNRWYPYPPGILVYNCQAYLLDGNHGKIDGEPTSGCVGKYVIINDDNPLFVADVYNYLTEPGSEEALLYGPGIEVEDGLEYEWIVDGKTVSTNKYYQIWGVSKPQGSKGASGNIRNDSWSSQTIDVTLIVKNEVGSVSTNISFFVWGGKDNNGLPIDWGRTDDTSTENVWDYDEDIESNYFWGTPFKLNATINDGSGKGQGTDDWNLTYQNINNVGGNTNELPPPWGSYYTWDGDSKEVIVLGATSAGVVIAPPDPAIYPSAIWMKNADGTGDTIVPPMCMNFGHGMPPAPEGNAYDGVYDNGWSAFDDNYGNYQMLSYKDTDPHIDYTVRKPATGGGSTYNNDLAGVKDYWNNKVWSFRGFPPYDGTGARGPLGETEYTIKENTYRSIWLKGNPAGGKDLIFKYFVKFKVLVDHEAELQIHVPANLPQTGGTYGQGQYDQNFQMFTDGTQQPGIYTVTELNSEGYFRFDFTEAGYELTLGQNTFDCIGVINYGGSMGRVLILNWWNGGGSTAGMVYWWQNKFQLREI